LEEVLDEPGDLRGDRPSGQALQDAGTDSRAGLGAAPVAALDHVKSAMPIMKIDRRLRASPSRPAGTSATPKACG
jgi:hypothetical protein